MQGLRTGVTNVDIAPLGVPGHPESSDTVLAGRFPDEEAPAVVELVREGGGEIVANVDETWTRPRAIAHQAPWTSGLDRTRVHA